MKLKGVRGMRDLLSDVTPAWRWVESEFEAAFSRYGYREVRTPIVERTELFARSIGESTDIVGKEMYTFQDRKGRSLSLRPEGTAGAVRAYVEHAWSQREPVTKWWYAGPMFRYEAVQAGRYRQFWQIGCEAFGAASPSVDAEQILLLDDLFRKRFQLPNLTLHLNSLGDADTRPAYVEALRAHLKGREEALCADCRRRLETNPLRVLDCKVPSCQPVLDGAPDIGETLSPQARAHFEAVRGLLDEAEVPYVLDPRLVRGLDYYNRTCFEFRSGDLGAQNAVAGGGRYDGLVRQLGGPDTPAVGFALGTDRLVSLIPEGLRPRPEGPTVALVAAGDDEVFRACFRLCQTLRREGVAADVDHRRGSVKSQMRWADKSGARYALVVGPDELERGEAELKPLRSDSRARRVRLDRLAEGILETKGGDS